MGRQIRRGREDEKLREESWSICCLSAPPATLVMDQLNAGNNPTHCSQKHDTDTHTHTSVINPAICRVVFYAWFIFYVQHRTTVSVTAC